MQKMVLVYDNYGNEIERIVNENAARVEIVSKLQKFADLPETIRVRGQELTRKQFAAVLKAMRYCDESPEYLMTCDFVYHNTPNGIDRSDAADIVRLVADYPTYD